MITLDGHQGVVTALAYAPHGRLLATGSADGQVKLWEPFSGQELATCGQVGPASEVSSLAFSHDGRLLAGGYLGGNVLVWSAASGRLLRRHSLGGGEAPGSDPTGVAFHPAEDRLAIAHYHTVVEVEPLSDRRLLVRTHPFMATQPHSISYFIPPHPWRCLRYAADGRLAAGCRDFAYVWSVTESGVKGVHWPTGDIVALDFSPDGRSLATARGRGVALWDLARPSHAGRKRTFRHFDQVRAVVLPPDGATLLSAGDDWTVHVWDLSSGQKRAEFNWRLGPVSAMVSSPDGMTVAVAGRKGPQVLIWDLEC
jgi:WD40 repeat protein